MTPEQIDRATPAEIVKMHDGYLWRLTHPAPEAVWLASVLANMSGVGGGLPWTPETLLGMKPTAHG